MLLDPVCRSGWPCVMRLQDLRPLFYEEIVGAEAKARFWAGAESEARERGF
jgi:hypothetical protein